MKVNCAVVAFVVRAKAGMRHKLRRRRFYWPPEWVDGAKYKHRRAAVPSGIGEDLAAIFLGVRLESPGCVRACFARHAELAEHRLRLFIPRDDERPAAIARAHLFEHGVH